MLTTIPFAWLAIVVCSVAMVALLISRLFFVVKLNFLSTNVVLVVLSFIISEMLVRSGFDLHLRHIHFAPICLFVFLPVLVFMSTFSIDLQLLKKTWRPALWQVIPSLSLTLAGVSTLLYWGIGNPSGFPWVTALLTTSILLATLPSPVFAFRSQKKAYHVLELESLLSGVVSLVLFTFVIDFSSMQQSLHHWELYLSIIWLLTKQVLGSCLLGSLAGWCFASICLWLNEVAERIVFLLLGVLMVAALAERFIGLSLVITVFFLGLSFNLKARKQISLAFKTSWQVLASLATIGLFILLGAVMSPHLFVERYIAIILAILALATTRFLGLKISHCCFPAKSGVLQAGERSNVLWMLWAGAERNPMSIALVFLLPTSLGGWWTAQSIVFGVVLISVLIQQPLFIWWASRGKL